MKKKAIILSAIFLAITGIVVGAHHLPFTHQVKRDYIAPYFFTDIGELPKFKSSFGHGKYLTPLGTTFIPEWKLTESERGLQAKTIAYLQIIPTGDTDERYKYVKLADFESYSIFVVKMKGLANNSNAWERITAEKSFTTNPVYSLNVQVLWKPSSDSVFQSREEALTYLQTFLENLVYSEKVMVEIADTLTIQNVKESIPWRLGTNDRNPDIDSNITGTWPESVKSAIWFGVMQNYIMASSKYASDELQNGTFCNDNFEQGYTIIPDNLTCQSNNSNGAVRLKIDDDIVYCVDTTVTRGIFKTNATTFSNATCK